MSGEWTFHLTDVASDTLLCDVTELAYQSLVQPRLNKPLALTVTLPNDNADLRAIQADGDPALYVGTRAIKAYRNGTLRGNCYVWTAEWAGTDDYNGRVTLSCFDPSIRLNARTLYDATGNLSTPRFANPINAGRLMREAMDNAVTFEDDVITVPGVGTTHPLIWPIATPSASIATTTNVWSLVADTPCTIGDVYANLVDSGVADFFFDPVDSAHGYDAGIMAKFRARNSADAPDKSGTIAFDYATAAKNVQSARRVLDMSTLGNRVYYYVGPKKDKNHWKYLISGTLNGLEAFETAQFASRDKYGTYMQTRIYDDDASSAQLEFGKALWKEEVQLRVNPRDLVYFTPAPGGDNFSQWEPFDDYNCGDIVAINSSDILGPQIADTKQRIYGFDVSIDSEGVEQVSELIASADAE